MVFDDVYGLIVLEYFDFKLLTRESNLNRKFKNIFSLFLSISYQFYSV